MKNKLSTLALIIVLFAMFTWKSGKLYDEKGNIYNPIAWDVFGYYLYLPSTFIYDDVALENHTWLDSVYAKYKPSPYPYQHTSTETNKRVIVYPIGLSMCYAPGFFLAHTYSKFSGGIADGYSRPYQVAFYLSAFIFTIIGIFLFRKILLFFFDDKIAAITILLVGLGTNYFFQTGLDGTMPHNFLFTLNCIIVLLTIKWHQLPKKKYALALGLVLGWVTICRPTEILWILVPLLWNVYNKQTLFAKFQLLKSKITHLAILVLAMVAIGSLQVIYWKYCTGHWFVYSHGEKLTFFDPYTLLFLFSYKKGWLLYTPLMIFSIIGFYFLYKQNKKIFFTTFIFFILNVYTLSSWECWWYAATYSQRPVVEMYQLLALPLACTVAWALTSRLKSVIVFSALTLLSALNIFQIWQFMQGIIDGERMTKTYYWRVFLKTNVTDEDRKYLEVPYTNKWPEYFDNTNNNYTRKEVLNLNFESATDKNIIDTMGYESKKCLMLNKEFAFSPSYSQAYKNISSKKHVWVRATAKVFPVTDPKESNASLVLSFNSNGRMYKYKATGIYESGFRPGQWNTITVDYMSPYVRHSYDKLDIYFWNMGSGTVLIDDFKAELFEPIVEY